MAGGLVTLGLVLVFVVVNIPTGAAGSSRLYLPVAARDATGPAVTAMTSDRPSPQPAGTSVTWTAYVNGPAEFRFSAAYERGPRSVVRDFDQTNTFTWTPIDEGAYELFVDIRSVGAIGVGDAQPLGSRSFQVLSRATNGPVVSTTANPLVALYSLPPCGAGTVRVLFNAGPEPLGGSSTPSAACSPDRGSNFYVVGMHPTTAYAMQAEVTQNGAIGLGPITSFTTGALPDGLGLPAVSVPLPMQLGGAPEPFVYHVAFPAGVPSAHFATDLGGAVVWYLRDPARAAFLSQPIPGGDVLVAEGPPSTPTIRIVDPAGNVVRETGHAALSRQLAGLTAGGVGQPYRFLHHDARLLPNGHIVLLAAVDRVLPPGSQGQPGGDPVDVLGDELIDLDPDLQVDWVWSSFDHLDIRRAPVLGEHASEDWGAVVDWTHSNAVVYSPADHALLLSVRHQDWIVKIDYEDGNGDGHVVWRLGSGGDFALDNPPPGDPFPWFSHQHGIALTPDGSLATFDDGNTRCTPVGADCHSRGQVYRLDEAGRHASLTVDADLGNYSFALGWAQLLSNGDYAFTSGWQVDGDHTFGQGVELDPTGTAALYTVQDDSPVYRTMRLGSMYAGCCDAPTGSAAVARRSAARSTGLTHPIRPNVRRPPTSPPKPIRGAHLP